MTYERTQEEQVDALHKASENALRQDRSDYLPGVFRAYLRAHVCEAEDRGAAKQRQKDAERADLAGWVHPEQLRDLLQRSDDPDRNRFIVMRKIRIGSRDVPLYTRPASVAALEARIARLEGALGEIRGAVRRAGPDVLPHGLWVECDLAEQYITDILAEGGAP